MLLPKNSYLTKLIISNAHGSVLHSGIAQTLAQLRQKYWVIQGHSAVQKVISYCLICIHWEGSPFKTPPFAPLPSYIVANSTNDESFVYTGMDYLGPVMVNENEIMKKMWICLFTCLKVTAIHLELVENTSANNFVLLFA